MSDPKPATEQETYTTKAEIFIPQRDGTNVVLAVGTVLSAADAKRMAKAGLFDLATGKAPKEK